MEEYKILSIKDGHITEIPVSVYNAKVAQKELSEIETKLRNLQQQLSDVMSEHFLADKLTPARGNLRDLAKDIIKGKSKFTFKEIVKELNAQCGTGYSKSAYYNAAKTVIGRMEIDKEVRPTEDGSYVNLAKEEKEEVEHDNAGLEE